MWQYQVHNCADSTPLRALWPENGASCPAGNLKLENEAAGKLEIDLEAWSWKTVPLLQAEQRLESLKLENFFDCFMCLRPRT